MKGTAPRKKAESISPRRGRSEQPLQLLDAEKDKSPSAKPSEELKKAPKRLLPETYALACKALADTDWGLVNLTRKLQEDMINFTAPKVCDPFLCCQLSPPLHASLASVRQEFRELGSGFVVNTN